MTYPYLSFPHRRIGTVDSRSHGFQPDGAVCWMTDSSSDSLLLWPEGAYSKRHNKDRRDAAPLPNDVTARAGTIAQCYGDVDYHMFVEASVVRADYGSDSPPLDSNVRSPSSFIASETAPMLMQLNNLVRSALLDVGQIGVYSGTVWWMNRLAVLHADEVVCLDSSAEPGNGTVLLCPRLSDLVVLLDKPLHCKGGSELATLAGIILPYTDDPVPDCVLALATHVPLYTLPDGMTIAEIQARLTIMIDKRRQEIVRRGIDMYRHLAEVVIGGGTGQAVVRGLAALLGMTTILTDDAYTILHIGTADQTSTDNLWPGSSSDLVPAYLGQGVAAILDKAHALSSLSSTAPPVVVVPFGETTHVVAPVVLRGQVTGYLIVVDGELAIDGLVAVAVGRAAAVCAIDATRKRAALETEMRMRGDFLEEVLTNSTLSMDGLRRRAHFLGCASDRAYVAVIFDLDYLRDYELLADAREARLQELKDRFVRSVASSVRSAAPSPLLWAYSDCVVVALPADPALPQVRLTAQIDRMRRAVQRLLAGTVTISAAIGRTRPSLVELRGSYIEALEAQRIGLTLHGPDHTTHFGDLGVYRLLFHLRDVPEAQPFYADSLAPLVEYDAENGTELVATLECYLACHGNMSRTATRMHMHRNGLLYRMQRITDLTGMDLDNAEQRLALHLSLLLRPLIPQQETRRTRKIPAVAPARLLASREIANLA